MLQSRLRSWIIIAADLKPRKFRTKWQQAVYEGPTVRKDSEAAERGCWIALLAVLLRSTNTPMGRLIREYPSYVQLLGGRHRAGTQILTQDHPKVHGVAGCGAWYQFPFELEATH